MKWTQKSWLYQTGCFTFKPVPCSFHTNYGIDSGSPPRDRQQKSTMKGNVLTTHNNTICSMTNTVICPVKMYLKLIQTCRNISSISLKKKHMKWTLVTGSHQLHRLSTCSGADPWVLSGYYYIITIKDHFIHRRENSYIIYSTSCLLKVK